MDRAAAKQRVEEMFALVGIDSKRFREYPHQFSGGMRQRAIIAMSLILRPSLVIADEPTTSLDVIVQDQILKNVRRLQAMLGFSMLLVTHDMALVIENCDHVGVMYGGKIMELGPKREVILHPFHPYTMGLKNSFPNILDRRSELISIPGVPPVLTGQLRGCRFASRCPFGTERCSMEIPALTEVRPEHQVACHYAEQAVEMRTKAARAETWLRELKRV
jgi:oligopeptide/dipeptide ABC transporter ATP-binding protein